MGDLRQLKISRLGAQGDGIADSDSRPVFVAYTLAGESVVADIEGERGKLVGVIKEAASRVAPVCKHFGPAGSGNGPGSDEKTPVGCGGCALQHFALDAYRDWKHGTVGQALAMRGIDTQVEPMISVGLGARRRAVLTARRSGKSVAIGFHGAGTHDLVDLEMCPVLAPEMVAVLPGLRELIGPLIEDRAELRITVLKAANGLDIDISGSSTRALPTLRARLAERATKLSILRLSLDKEPLFQQAPPYIRCGTAEVVPAPGTFLQASAEAEAAMADLVLGALGKRAKRAADLFCGVGAFSFVLASRAKVVAMDSDAAALDALEEAKRRVQGLRGIEARRRDLYQEPLSRKELEPFDLVVFDPPRAGAKAQAEMLAKSKVPVVVAVSCNPSTLARDLRILLDGGYRLESVTPIDQFLFTAHVEVVSVLRR